MNKFPHLLSPLLIGKTEVRNRILVSAHVPGFAENNKPGERYIAYHRRYARNGVDLQITGDCVAPRTVEIAMSEALMVANKI